MSYSDDDVIDHISSGEDNTYSDDGGDSDIGFAEEDIYNRSHKSYVVLKEEDIRKHQRDEIERVSTALSISQVEAIALLLHYHWSVSKVEDEWFTDEERVRNIVGILKEPVVDVSGRKLNIQCGVCFESYTQNEVATVSCGHPYCHTCWTGYISTKIKDGLGCLRVKCPEPSCSAAVGQDMIDKVSKEEEKEKYYRYLYRSYVEEDGKKIKWCPSPGCEYAIEFDDGSTGSGSSSYNISCLCSNSFCWNCSEDAHSPVDCDTVSKWIFKNQDESANKNWILANSKPCPKCKRPIEKNNGCNHMTCSSPCRHEFCWQCMDPWGNHVACNKFVDETESEDKRKLLNYAIARYTHYYVKWAGNQSSRLKAMGDLEKLQSVQLKELTCKLGIPETQLEFTVEAWVQIIECRRVLKWTYAYGYYLYDRSKRQLFEYLQGEAETGLERLHHCAEVELNHFVSTKTEDPSQTFNDFRKKLTDLTKVTKTYFENLVKALENGLADVEYNEGQSTQEAEDIRYNNMMKLQWDNYNKPFFDYANNY